jgi:hypothetical protein
MRPEDVFQNIRDLMVFGGNITNVSEVDTTSTITTDSIGALVDGMLIEIGNSVYSVDNITRTAVSAWTFTVTGTGITASTWELALYYEFGRALEVGNTLKDKKGDPTNKNKRFPLMWLLTDIQKNEGIGPPVDYEADILIAFVYISEKNLRAKKRIEDKFEPILDPLVDLFKTTIKTSPGSRYFVLEYGEVLNIIPSDKFKYGSVEGNKHIFDDISDAIELNMTLKFFKAGTACNIY